MENIIKMMMDASQPEVQVEIHPYLFGKFMPQIPIWNYSSMSRESFIADSNLKKKN